MFSRLTVFPLTASLLAFCGSCTAADTAHNEGWYIGAGAGEASINGDYPFTGADNNYFGIKKQTTATGFKLYGGYQWNDYWAAELTYLYFGKYTVHYAGAFSAIKTSGLGFSAVGVLPLTDEFMLLGKAGVLAKSAEIGQHNIDYSFINAYRTTRVAPLLGVGAQYRLTPALSVRAEYDYAGRITLDYRGASMANQLLSVSLNHQF